MDTEVRDSTLPASSPQLLLDQLCEYLERNAAEAPQLLCDFARQFVGRSTRQLAQERSLEEQAALTVGAFRFLQRSHPERVNVEVFNPEEEGWPATVTVLRVNLGDRPFVVDTIR